MVCKRPRVEQATGDDEDVPVEVPLTANVVSQNFLRRLLAHDHHTRPFGIC